MAEVAERRRERTAAIVIIGDEILSGKTADTNTPFLLAQLRDLGVAVRRILVVPDEIEDIVEAVRSTQPRHDFVFTSGGVGPTHDDVTLEALAVALGRQMLRSPVLEEMIRALGGGHPIKETHLRMADIPEGTELLTAPGLRIPVLLLENIYVLPGIPEIFREKFTAIRERFRCDPFHLVRVYSKRGEGSLAPLMSDLVARFPAVSVGSYPTLTQPEYRVMVTLESKEPEALRQATEAFLVLLGAANLHKVEEC